MRYLAFILAVVGSATAGAYVGPGTAFGVVVTVFGVVIALLLGLLGILYYPIKRLIRSIKSRVRNRV